MDRDGRRPSVQQGSCFQTRFLFRLFLLCRQTVWCTVLVLPVLTPDQDLNQNTESAPGRKSLDCG